MLNFRIFFHFLLFLIINRTYIFFAESNPLGKALLGPSYQPAHARMPAHPTGRPNNQPYLLKPPPLLFCLLILPPSPPHPPSAAASSFSLPHPQIRCPPALPLPPASHLRADPPTGRPPSLAPPPPSPGRPAGPPASPPLLALFAPHRRWEQRRGEVRVAHKEARWGEVRRWRIRRRGGSASSPGGGGSFPRRGSSSFPAAATAPFPARRQAAPPQRGGRQLLPGVQAPS
jgi:hypothetical protein